MRNAEIFVETAFAAPLIDFELMRPDYFFGASTVGTHIRQYLRDTVTDAERNGDRRDLKDPSTTDDTRNPMLCSQGITPSERLHALFANAAPARPG